jgi:hypothetical protein
MRSAAQSNVNRKFEKFGLNWQQNLYTIFTKMVSLYKLETKSSTTTLIQNQSFEHSFGP